MKNISFLKNYLIIVLSVFAFSFQTIQAQYDLSVYQCPDSASVIAMIDSVLLFNVEPEFKKNIKFTGDPRSVGYFTKGTIFGFSTPTGIVLSSGFSGDLDKSNDCNPGNANSNTSGGSDPDLAMMTSLSINDACIVEFDIMLFNDSVFLSYVFGSEEYHDYVNTSFNDVFGFFLSGPEINGPFSNNAINISVVPGTNEAVMISTVNCGKETSGCNPPPGNGPNCEYLVDNKDQTNPAFNQFALDAYTVQFITEQLIQSFEWYHIKLAIGDVGDGAYDSSVFLEKGSIISIPVPDINIAEAETEEDVIEYIDSVLLGDVIESNKANITFTGDPKSIGYFDDTDFLNLTGNSGVLFSSGYAGSVPQPNECNSSSNISTDNAGLNTDPDLELLVGRGVVSDVSVVEFDYRSSNETIDFNYVFASEEYHDLINTGHYDVFGIFLSGPGIKGGFLNNAVNLAVLPDSDIPVNSASINFGSGGLTCEGKPGGCLNCEWLIDNSQKTDSAFFAIAYDGYTIPLNATYPVTPGEWYHIKIAMADGETSFDDSGIFLSSGTLVSDSLMTDVRNNTFDQDIQIRPNPAKEYIDIFNSGDEQIVKFAFYDISGRLLKKGLFDGSRISISDLPKGMLFIELSSENYTIREKLLHH